MRPLESTLEEIFRRGNRRFYIPLYQRNYSWTAENARQFIESIRKNINANGKVGLYIGEFYLDAEERTLRHTKQGIIDGQQRITTCMLFLKALHDLSNDENLKKKIWNDYICDDGNNVCKLTLSKKDQEVFSKIMKEKITHDINQDKYSNLVIVYKFFKSEISVNISKYSIEDCLFGFNHLRATAFETEPSRGDNAQEIFEYKNSSGVPLEQSDLIRSFLLSTDLEKQMYLYEEYWYPIEMKFNSDPNRLNDFLRDFIQYKAERYIPKNSHYKAFKTLNQSQEAIEETLVELKKSIKHFEYIMGWETYPNINVAKRLSSLRTMETTVLRPLLLFLLKEREENSAYFSLESLNSCLEFLETYLFRMIVCQKLFKHLANNSINILRSCNSLPKFDLDIGLKYFKIIIEALSVNTNEPMPTNFELKRAFVDSSFPKHMIEHLFSRISEHVTGMRIDTKDFTVEHIMPQNLSYGWITYLGDNSKEIHSTCLHKIGNLTLLTRKENSSITDKSFELKKITYQSAAFPLAKRISESTVWNESEINKKSEEYYDFAIKVWPIPDAQGEILKNIHNISTLKTYTLTSFLDVSKSKPTSITINGKEFVVTSWKKFFEYIVVYAIENYNKEFNDYLDSKQAVCVLNDISGCNTETYELRDGIYIVSKLKSNYVLNECIALAKSCKMQDDITFTMRKIIKTEVN